MQLETDGIGGKRFTPPRTQLIVGPVAFGTGGFDNRFFEAVTMERYRRSEFTFLTCNNQCAIHSERSSKVGLMTRRKRRRSRPFSNGKIHIGPAGRRDLSAGIDAALVVYKKGSVAGFDRGGPSTPMTGSLSPWVTLLSHRAASGSGRARKTQILTFDNRLFEAVTIECYRRPGHPIADLR